MREDDGDCDSRTEEDVVGLKLEDADDIAEGVASAEREGTSETDAALDIEPVIVRVAEPVGDEDAQNVMAGDIVMQALAEYDSECCGVGDDIEDIVCSSEKVALGEGDRDDCSESDDSGELDAIELAVSDSVDTRELVDMDEAVDRIDWVADAERDCREDPEDEDVRDVEAELVACIVAESTLAVRESVAGADAVGDILEVPDADAAGLRVRAVVSVAVCELKAVALDESEAVADSVTTEIVARDETVAVPDADTVAQVDAEADVERDSCGDSLPRDVEDDEVVGNELGVEDNVDERVALVDDDPEAEDVITEGVDETVAVSVEVMMDDSVSETDAEADNVGNALADSTLEIECDAHAVGL